MGKGISEVLPFAIGVAISPVSISAVTLMLLSRRARVNGPAFLVGLAIGAACIPLVGWVVALATVSIVVYLLTDQSDPTTGSSASDTISWGKIVLGVLFLLLAVRNWRKRPAPGTEPEMPKWMSGIDALSPVKTFGLGVLLAVLNPKNLVLAVGAAAGVAQLGLSTGDVVVSLIVFVALASIAIAGPVVYYLLGGQRAQRGLDELKDWLRIHDAAVMTVLFIVFGVILIAKGIGLLS